MAEDKRPPRNWQHEALFWRSAYETLRGATMYCPTCRTMTRMVDVHTGHVVEDPLGPDRPQEQKTINIADAIIRSDKSESG